MLPSLIRGRRSTRAVRLALGIVWALLRVGLAQVSIWFIQPVLYGSVCVGILVGVWCIGWYAARELLADFIQRQGFSRPRCVPESPLW